MNSKIGDLIEKYRKEKGLTQSELAKKLGVSNTAISKWENGNNLPDITLLEPLSEILGIDKLLLFTSESEETIERTKSIKKSYFIKNFISILVFLLLLLFTNYISYKVYKHKIDELEKTKTEIYRFYSQDNEYFVNGYIIFKGEESTIIFDQLSYQDIRTTKEKSKTKEKEEITSVELFFYINENVVLKNKYIPESKEKKDYNEILTSFIKTVNQKKIKINNKIKMSTSQVVLIINKNNKISDETINIKIRKEI